MLLIRNVFAQESLGGPIGGEGLGPFGGIGSGIAAGAAGGTTGLEAVTRTISAIVGFMTIAAGIWFIFQFLVGGFFWMTSAGDKAKLHEARERLTNAFVGLLIVVASWAILALVSQFTGVNFIISNPGEIIGNLGIK